VKGKKKTKAKDGVLLVLDVGTGSVRGVLFDLEGRIVQKETRARTYLPDPSGEPMTQIFDTGILWSNICDLTRALIRQSGVPRESILAVSTTCQRLSYLFLDKDGEALYAGPNLDPRGVYTQAEIENLLGREYYELTGQFPPLTSALARILWYRLLQPETCDRIRTVLMLNDWVQYKLCGEMRSEVTAASGSGFLEVKTGVWSRKIAKTFGLDQDLFPPLVPAGEVIGGVLPGAAGETGLKPGTPVVVSGADTQCALLGGGLWGPDQIGIVAGTTAMICRSLDAPYVDPEKRLWASCHIEPKSWILEANLTWAGTVLLWIQNLLGLATKRTSEGVDMYAWMEKEASAVPPGAGETYAFLGPMIMNEESFFLVRPGVFFFPPPAHPLTESPAQAGHFFRAILENIAFALRGNMEQIRAVKPFYPDRVFLTGGMASNNLFCRIVSDCLEMPVFVGHIREATALGAAICAAAGIGAFPGLSDAQKGLVRMDMLIEPEADQGPIYQEAFLRWKDLYQKIIDL